MWNNNKQTALEFYSDEKITRKSKVGDIVILTNEDIRFDCWGNLVRTIFTRPVLIVRQEDYNNAGNWRRRKLGLL